MRPAAKKTAPLAAALVGACLTYLAAACGNSAEESPNAGGGPANAGTGGSVGGTAGASGGTTGGAPGGTTGTVTGGASGSGSGATGGTGAAAGGGAGVGGTGAGVGGASGTGAASGAGGSTAGAGGSGLAGAGGTSGDSSSGGTGGTPVEPMRPGVVTSGPGAYWQVGTLTAASGAATVTVNDSMTFQDWLGFGGTFNEAGWDALAELSQEERNRAIRLLFSPTEGANFKWGRLPIGASDYALDRYTLNETAGDYAMANFSIDRDKLRLIPFIKAALAIKPDIRLWASPWTPPSWMKNPAEIDGTDATPSGSPPATFEAFMKDDDQTLEAYALYFARFIEAYAAEGIRIDGVYPQNEPGYATRYPSCRWAGGLLGKFVGDYLGPTFEARNLDTEIWFGTLSNNDSTIYSGNIGGLTGAAAEYAVGVGLQWNTINHTSELAQRGFLVMQTEHRCGNYPFSVPGTPAFNPDKPANDHAYGVESWGYIRDWLKAGVNSYSAWNMVLDTAGKNLDNVRPWPQNALLVVDRASDELTATPAYYVFRHFSYFVDPGAKRVEATGGDAIAFKNPDGSLVAVVFNSGSGAAATKVAIGGNTYEVQIPGQGWASVYVEGT